MIWQKRVAWAVFVVCLILCTVLLGFMMWVQPLVLVGLGVFLAFVWAASVIEGDKGNNDL